MAKRGKTIAEEDDLLLDRISVLPINVINHILDFIPNKIAARTSVLSRNWRYICASRPNIKIDLFFLESYEREKGTTLKCLNIVNKILFRHIGPVLKFSFKFPWNPTNEFDYSLVDHWLVYLSRNGVRELTLTCYSQPYLLPSHIFSSTELVVLSLKSCIFNLPNGDGALRKLKTITLHDIDFLTCKITFALNTPQLTYLSFLLCSNVCHFKICAPKLKTLILEWSTDVDLIDFEMSEITTIALVGSCTFKETGLVEFFKRRCLLSSFYVDGSCLQFFTADSRLVMLPTMTSCLTHLVLTRINWSDLHQIVCILYLLRSSTSLSRLEISVEEILQAPTNEASNYLDVAHDMNWTLNCLKIIVIQYPSGSIEEMRFIKLLLSCAPRLKKIFVERRKDDPRSNCNLLQQLVRFPRASKEAEIIFEPNVKVAKVPDAPSFYDGFEL